MRYLPTRNSCLSIFVILTLALPLFDIKGAGAATADEILQWLDSHNQYRKKHNVQPVVWSNAVAASAQNHADSCPDGHSSSGYGENMAWGYPSITSVVKAWYDEEKNYDYSNPGFSGSTGHFTQVVWKGTTEIGCALKTQCPRWSRTWVCQYNPPGNYLGQFAQNVFPPTTVSPPVSPPGPPANGTVLLPALNLLLEEN